MSDIWLAGPLTSAAYGWRLDRRDGVTIGFTSHDRDVEIDGLVYSANPGMEPSAISESLGLDSGGLEISGTISNGAIREDHLSAGRWDRADLSIFLFDWTQPSAGQRLLAQGQLGEVSYSDERFQVDLQGIAAKLKLPIVPQASPGCRAQFCDTGCGLNYRRFLSEHVVATVNGAQIIFAGALPGPVNGFAYGQLRWLDGKNAGLISPIFSSDTDSVLLAEHPYHAVASGTRAALFQGCDKILSTCSGRFNNAVNFRGEPHLPGNDLLTRYPGAN
jgi:uncharacterized phage protein (TIGR02218 family)